MLCFANRHSSFRLFRLDGAEVGLVFADVVLERHQQSLGVFRSHDDSALHAGLWSVWHHADEVHKELIYRVSDDSQVGILPDAISGVNSIFISLWSFSHS